MKLLLIIMLGLSSSLTLAGSWENAHLVTVTGEGSNCAEAGEDLILQLNEMGVDMIDVDITMCQSPNMFNKPMIQAEVLMNNPHM